MPSDIELSYHARKRPVKDPNGLTFLDKSGSEESILNKKNGDKNGTGVSAQAIPPRGSSPPDAGIMRTDEVTVSHSSGSQQMVGEPQGFNQRQFYG